MKYQHSRSAFLLQFQAVVYVCDYGKSIGDRRGDDDKNIHLLHATFDLMTSRYLTVNSDHHQF